MPSERPLPKALAPSTIILARAVVTSARRTGTPVRDPRIFDAAKQPLPTESAR